MMCADTPLRRDHHIIIPDRGGQRILMLPDNKGWRLPVLSTTGRVYWQDTAHINRAMHEVLGADATILRCLSSAHDDAHGIVSMLYAAENHSPAGHRRTMRVGSTAQNLTA